MTDETGEKQERLRSVLWLGGSACSGKTEVARRLAAEHGLALYHTDESYERLRQRADPRRHPAFCRVGDLALAELLAASAAAQAAAMLDFHREHLELVVEELLAMRPAAPLLVEGSCLLPPQIATLTADPRQALWLLATPHFRRRLYRCRGSWVADTLAACVRPDAAFERWMARDDALADWRRRHLQSLGLAWRDIDGGQDAATVAAAAAVHFRLAAAAPTHRSADRQARLGSRA